MAAFIEFRRHGSQEDIWVNPWHVCSVYPAGQTMQGEPITAMRLHSGQEICVAMSIHEVIASLQEE